MNQWVKCSDRLPPRDRVVETKIDDGRGVRNQTTLKQMTGCGRLWFDPDGSMYMYYTPTHWREVQTEEVV